jgi:hypothetical protein
VVLLEGPRVRLAPFEVDEIKAIALGLRRKDWAGDYPSDGDRIIAEHKKRKTQRKNNKLTKK